MAGTDSERGMKNGSTATGNTARKGQGYGEKIYS
jgi:hypothetical protein